MQNEAQRTEDRVTQVVLVAAVLGSVAGNLLAVPVKWQIPLIFVALYGIYRSVLPIRQLVADVTVTRETLGRLEALVESHAIMTFSNANEFYESLTRALDETTSSVDLTHIRAEAPDDFGVSAHGWFSQVRDWVRTDPSSRSVRRIISVQNDAMENWARALAVETQGLPFYVSVIDWPLAIPAVNVAILDGQRVYMALPGPTPQRSAGVFTEDVATVRHFRETMTYSVEAPSN